MPVLFSYLHWPAQVIIRSHQLPDSNRGYDVRHAGHLITVFSASNYCGSRGNTGAVMVFSGPGKFEFREYMAPALAHLEPALAHIAPTSTNLGANLGPPLQSARRRSSTVGHVPRDLEAKVQESVLLQLQTIVMQHAEAITERCLLLDGDSDGLISVDDWCKAMRAVTGLQIEFRDYAPALLGHALTPQGHVQWKPFVEANEIPTTARGEKGQQESFEKAMDEDMIHHLKQVSRRRHSSLVGPVASGRAASRRQALPARHPLPCRRRELHIQPFLRDKKGQGGLRGAIFFYFVPCTHCLSETARRNGNGEIL